MKTLKQLLNFANRFDFANSFVKRFTLETRFRLSLFEFVNFTNKCLDLT